MGLRGRNCFNGTMAASLDIHLKGSHLLLYVAHSIPYEYLSACDCDMRTSALEDPLVAETQKSPSDQVLRLKL